MRLGMFDDEYKKRRINAFIEEIKAMPEDNEILAIIGGDADNISAEGMDFIKRRTYEDLVIEYALPKYLFPDEKMPAFRVFFHNLRFTITHFPPVFVYEEIPTPSYEDGRKDGV